jgi:hypothetical protein
MKYAFFALITCLALTTVAQQKIQVDVGGTFNKSDETQIFPKQASTAIGIFVEPGYQITDHWLATLRVQPLGLAFGVERDDGSPRGIRSGSYMTFNNTAFIKYQTGFPGDEGRFFVGLGTLVVIQRPFARLLNGNGDPFEGREWDLSPGLVPQVGMTLKKWTASVEYAAISRKWEPYVGVNIGYRIFE